LKKSKQDEAVGHRPVFVWGRVSGRVKQNVEGLPETVRKFFQCLIFETLFCLVLLNGQPVECMTLLL
jgi:hypothetical protein